LLVKTIKK